MIRVFKKTAKKLGNFFSNDKKEEKTFEDWISIKNIKTKKIKTKKQRRIESRKRKKRKRISERRRKKNRRR